MFGAILGDIIGSPFEFGRNDRVKDFPLFSENSTFTDDSVMTVAIGWALMKTAGGSDRMIRETCIYAMRELGHEFPDAGYGGGFARWLKSRDPRPYNSYGNGSAMRVSAAGWIYDDMESVRRAARLTAEVTHNHPEGNRGAESVAAAIFLARMGCGKGEIKDYVEREFGYDLSRSCDEIRPGYTFNETCQGTVPEAFAAFLEGESFEDVIRTAVSLGGDSDTLAAIAGSMAEAYYGLTEDMKKAALCRLPESLAKLLRIFDVYYGKTCPAADPLHEAINFAARAHAGQKRKGTDIDYITHPMEVMNILTEMGANRELRMAGVLHDTVEDTDTTPEEIEKRFGERVKTLVMNHSARPDGEWMQVRRHTLKMLKGADRDTRLLILADKVANLRSMASDHEKVGEELWKRFNAPKERQAWYVSGMIEALEDLKKDENACHVYDELVRRYKDLFEDFYVDDDTMTLWKTDYHNQFFIYEPELGDWVMTEEILVDGRVITRQQAERFEEISCLRPWYRILS